MRLDGFCMLLYAKYISTELYAFIVCSLSSSILLLSVLYVEHDVVNIVYLFHIVDCIPYEIFLFLLLLLFFSLPFLRLVR